MPAAGRAVRLGADRTEAVTRARQLGLIRYSQPVPGGTVVPGAGPMALSCPLAGCGRFHWHGHLRVTPIADAGSYRLMQDQPQDDRGPQDQVHPQPRPEVRNVSTPAPVPAG
jgi:hypothetical protein